MSTRKITAGVEPVQDFLTVLRSNGPKFAKKIVSLDDVKSYDKALWVQAEERPVSNIKDLSDLLFEIENDPQCCVIRGRLRHDWREILAANWDEWSEGYLRKTGSRLRQPPGDWQLRRSALFEDVPHHWILLDSDEFRPQADPIGQVLQAAQEYIQRLPEGFEGVSYHLQLSNSAGLPVSVGVFKAHLWFWLEVAYTSVQLKAWAEGRWPTQKGRPLDISLFQPVQVHYTSAPILESGVVLPVDQRSYFVDMRDHEVALRLGEEAREAAASLASPSSLVDPRTKPGLVGAYCRAFSIEKIVQEHIPGVFEFVTDDRLTWRGGSGAAEGAFVRADRQGIGASHNSWPWGPSRVVNKFDLVRHFKFGHLDVRDDELESEVWATSQPHRLPSHAAMCSWVKGLPEVQRELPDEDPDKMQTARAVIDRLRGMSKDEILESWTRMVLPLARDAAHEVVEEINRLCPGIGVRRLNSTLADARSQAEAERLRNLALDRVGERRLIDYRPENKSEIAKELEQLIISQVEQGQYICFGGLLAQVTTKTLPYTHLVDHPNAEPPTVSLIEPLDEVGVLLRAERVAAFCETRNGVPHLMGVPAGLIDILLKKKAHAAPQVTGIVTHPIVMRTGEILCTDGLHSHSGLFLQGASCPDAQPYTQPQARQALARIRGHLLGGFEFATDLDEDAAIAGLFTGVQRRLAEMAPGLAIVAGAQSSGKTTLARRIHIILTGQDMPVSTFPQGDEAEMQKRLLSMLLRSPAMVCFDNISDGTTFRSATLAAAMTGPVLTQRVLGMSRDADCLTNVLFVITGNNLSLGADEATRWMMSRLAPGNAHPEERVFSNPDVFGHASAIRSAVLQDVVGIVSGWLRSTESMQVQTRFVQWDRMVRQPLIWAGANDLALCFKASAANSEDLLAFQGLMQILWEIFAESTFRARDVAKICAGQWEAFEVDEPGNLQRLMLDGRDKAKAFELGAELSSVLANLRARDSRSEKSVGKVLKAKVGRVALVKVDEAERGVALMSTPSRGVQVFRLERRN